jgi:hypothetical protein
MDTILSVSEQCLAGKDFAMLLGNFLDEFYISSDGKRNEMLESPPLELPQRQLVPLLAATAHKLANDYGLKPPRWVFETRCFLPHNAPYFSHNAKGDLRLWYMFMSPSEFKFRNLFCSENVLSRV